MFPANWQAVVFFAERGFRCLERSMMDGKPIGMRPEAVEAMVRVAGESRNLELFDQLMTLGDGASEGERADA